MHFKNRPALREVRHVHVNLPVEAPGTHQSLVQNIGAVGRRQDDDPAVGAKPIHLREELIQGVLALVVRTHAGVFAPSSSDCVNLINEDDGRCLFLGLLEQIPNAGSPYAYEHFHEVRTA